MLGNHIAIPHLMLPGLRNNLLPAGLAFTPVLCLALDLRGDLPLWVGAVSIVLPSAGVLLALAAEDGRLARRLALGLLAGALATVPYDLLRLTAVALGGLPADPVPGFGRALGVEPAAVGGYLWRYLGDGGGMGMAFCALGLGGGRAGLGFGMFVSACLLVVLASSAAAQAAMFPLTPVGVGVVVCGHAIWGVSLGAFVAEGGHHG